MAIALKIVIGLLALLLLVMGINLMFNPAEAGAGVGLTADGVAGLNTLRGDFGGMFLGCTVLLVLGLVQQRAEWFIAVAVVMALIAIGRVVGFAVDGSPVSANVTAFGVEIVIVLLMVAAARVISRTS